MERKEGKWKYEAKYYQRRIKVKKRREMKVTRDKLCQIKIRKRKKGK